MVINIKKYINYLLTTSTTTKTTTTAAAAFATYNDEMKNLKPFIYAGWRKPHTNSQHFNSSLNLNLFIFHFFLHFLEHIKEMKLNQINENKSEHHQVGKKIVC